MLHFAYYSKKQYVTVVLEPRKVFFHSFYFNKHTIISSKKEYTWRYFMNYMLLFLQGK